ncbi:MAG: trypsin-like serine protease [Sphingobacteriales bacterium]|nr:MAG: trypsin-like serine protease [Sphingobacteriales bacterium]
MSIQDIIEHYERAVVQIATGTGTGTGFYLHGYELIVTNYHVVRDNTHVSVKIPGQDKKLAKVVFYDERYDLAFLLPPVDMNNLPALRLGNYRDMKDGDSVLAIGHPFGLNYTATQGVISRVDRVQQGLNYIQIDAAINPGNSGGPLVDDDGSVVGVNTFIIKGGDNLGFALPVSYLKEALDQYKLIYSEVAIRCPNCATLVTEKTLDNHKYCPNCGTAIDFNKLTEPETDNVSGIANIIEQILELLGYDKKLSRSGQNKWEVKKGSATIKISYNADNYFIICDAYLCRLPRQGIKELYTYLLKENAHMHSKLFALKGENIILSSLIYDIDIKPDTGKEVFSRFFERADYYDNYLEEQYKCPPILEEDM